jgi:hypothetical protein
MSPTDLTDYEAVFARVRAWPPAQRLALAEAILSSLRPALQPPPPRGVPAEQVLGMAAGQGPPPDDEAVKRWVEEHRREKYG